MLAQMLAVTIEYHSGFAAAAARQTGGCLGLRSVRVKLLLLQASQVQSWALNMQECARDHPFLDSDNHHAGLCQCVKPLLPQDSECLITVKPTCRTEAD